ncbi:hypothetical protein EBH_0008190 [Eimeria brunetti]|uniref:Uncharacterized protein n=1 Tax=Eimeria brunetti TaxID=51314 RepID=U6LWM1_9EIME|nr:hypothetical protein EBH_0008190 [Eimeria brunetti]
MKCPWKQSAALRKVPSTRGNERVKLSLTGDALSNGSTQGGRSGRSSTPLPPTVSRQNHMDERQKLAGTLRSPSTLCRGSPSAEMLRPSGCAQQLGLKGNKSRATTPYIPDDKPVSVMLEADGKTASFETREKGPVPAGPVEVGTLEPRESRECISDGPFATVATNTDFALRPPWAAVHVGSHDLLLCPTRPRRIISAAQAAAASFMGAAQRSEHRGSSLASRATVIPRRNTFTTFREWLAQDHRHSRRAWGPSGQFPARRGLSHSATTERSRILLSAAAMKRSAAESRARHAVEAEVRELSTNQTPQQQQEAYLKAQQKALALQRQQQPTVDEAVAREEARAAAAAAAAAAASAAIAQAQWPSRHKLRQQELEQMHRQEAKAKRSQGSGSACDRQQPTSGARTSTRSKSNDSLAQVARKQKPSKTPEILRNPFTNCKPEPATAASVANVKYANGMPPSRPPANCPWSTKPRPAGQPSKKRLKQLSAKEPLRRSIMRENVDAGNHVDCMDGTSQASGDEEDAEPFNPLDEVLVLLRKIKRAESYSFNIPRNKRSAHKGAREDKKKQQAAQAFSAVAEGAWSNTKTNESSGKILASLGPADPEGEPRNDHQQYERNPSQNALSRLKHLPLEAFDIPEEYGEASPEALLQRCRLECQQRRLKMRQRSERSSLQIESPSCEAVNQTCSPEVSALPETIEASACAPSDGAPMLQQIRKKHELMACSPQQPGPQTECQSVGDGSDKKCASAHDLKLSEEEQSAFRADDVDTNDETKIKAAQPANENTGENAEAAVEDSTEGEAEAEVLHFVGNSWTRLPCVILHYDNEQRRFEVQLRDGTVKTVRRLALRFCFEPPHLQQQRIETCTSRRRQALTRQHFLNSVNALPSTAFSPLPQSFINCIIKGATGIGRLRNRSPPTDSLRSAVQHLKSRFMEASKLSAVLHCAERLRAAGKLESRLLSQPPQQMQQQKQQVSEENQEGEEGKEQAPLLQVLQPMLPTPPPALGRCTLCLQLSLLVEGTFCDLGGLSFFDLPSRKLQRISFARIFKKSAALKVAERTIPDPDQYLIYQQALSSDVAEALRELGRDSLCHALISAFGPLHTAAGATPYANVTGATGSAAASSAISNSGTNLPDIFLRRQLIRFNAMLRSNLLSFVIDSANEWKHYMLQATERLDPELQTGRAAAPAAAVEAGFSLKRNLPCFLQLHIIIANDSAAFHPGEEKQVNRTSIPYIGFYQGCSMQYTGT